MDRMEIFKRRLSEHVAAVNENPEYYNGNFSYAEALTAVILMLWNVEGEHEATINRP